MGRVDRAGAGVRRPHLGAGRLADLEILCGAADREQPRVMGDMVCRALCRVASYAA
jgi:hypothetical protein